MNKLPSVNNLELYALPVQENILVVAPRRGLAALVNRSAAALIRRALLEGGKVAPAVQPLVAELEKEGKPLPGARTGPLRQPFFLGIIPTRGCNLSCRYCDFPVASEATGSMPIPLARQAVTAYFDLLQSAGETQAEIHFFGGEPFFAPQVIHFVVEAARLQAARRQMSVRFEVTTNGVFRAADCDWIGDHLDSVVLSLDGPQEIQDEQRPAASSASAFEVIQRNARRLSHSPAELIFRACVTHKTVERLEEIADWMSQAFHPSLVCFEGLTPSPRSIQHGLQPPDPWRFAANFQRASRLLEAQGIETVLSTAVLSAYQSSSCPLGKDALIVAPDGSLEACYQLPQDWQRHGLDFHLGRLDGRGFEIPSQALQRVRDFAARPKPLCENCFCRFHCAGGCPISHPTDAPAGQYDDLCIQTRLVSAAGLLNRLGYAEMADSWLEDPQAVHRLALQPNDRLEALEMEPQP